MLNITASRRGVRKNLEINIAPLIDMVFILLIFFLVTTSFVKETGVDISRPSASTAVSSKGAVILIGITQENRVYMDRREIDIRSVRANIERALAETPDSSVIIVADKKSSTGTVINVMDNCKIAGAEKVSLAASLPKSKK